MAKYYILWFCVLMFTKQTVAQADFKGKWRGVCLTEKVDTTNYKTCSLCAYNKKVVNSEKPILIELDFYLEDVTVKIGDYTSIKDFDYNKNQHMLEFFFAERLFKFKVLETDDPHVLVLKDEEQNVILLYKK